MMLFVKKDNKISTSSEEAVQDLLSNLWINVSIREHTNLAA